VVRRAGWSVLNAEYVAGLEQPGDTAGWDPEVGEKGGDQRHGSFGPGAIPLSGALAGGRSGSFDPGGIDDALTFARPPQRPRSARPT
jgi:hypothetical protein